MLFRYIFEGQKVQGGVEVGVSVEGHTTVTVPNLNQTSLMFF